MLHSEDEQKNSKIVSDGIIVEKSFEQLSALWCILDGKRRWYENLFDPYFKMYLTLIITYIKSHPIREVDRQ